MAAFAKTSSCNSAFEKCQHSLKSSFKRVKSCIQEGANPEKAARRSYDQACDYLELWNKTILVQQRALACLSKSLAHILQRELYAMGNTGLLRREAEMTLLQPHLGQTRRQELKNSPFWPSSLFKSQSRREKTSSSKKASLKVLRVSYPTKISPFVVPTTRKEAPTGNPHPMGATPLKIVTNRFPRVGGNRISEAPRAVFDLTLGGEGVETPPPNDSSKAYLSPPVGGRLHSFRRDLQTNKCSNNQWLRSSIRFKTKTCRSPSDSIKIQGPSIRTSSDHLYPVSSVKERNRKVGKCKISRILQSSVLSKPHQGGGQ